MIRSCLYFFHLVVLVPAVCLCRPTLAAEPAPLPLRELMAGEPTRGDLTRAHSSLDEWETTAPEKARRVMRVCYWSPADREPQPRHRERLTGVMRSVQAFYLREMAAWGFPGRTIQLEDDADGLVRLYMVKGTLKSEECSETDSSDGRAIRADCLKELRAAGVDGDAETLVIFCNLADWNPGTREIGHHSPYYASGDYRSGTAWQVDSALLDAAWLGVKEQHVKDRQYGRISLGKYNSIFVGGVCHELGHALGLPHCVQSAAMRAVRGSALMGSGNRTYGDELRGDGRGSFLTLPHALKLAAHPQFSGSVKQLGTALRSTFTDWKLEPVAEGLRVSATVRANLPMHAVLAYADPAGGSDYDAEIAAAVPDEQGRFTLLLPLVQKKNSSTATLRIGAVGVNGAATVGLRVFRPIRMEMRLTAAGGYDVAGTMQKIEFDEYWPAFRDGKITPETLAKLSLTTQALFTRLRAADSTAGKPAPERVPAEKREVALSELLPSKASTGWQGVHFDRTPEGGPLIGPGGLIAHGLYAHADSEHEYQLGGKWSTFSGSACLLEQGFGPVQATIIGDGHTLWESPVLISGDTAGFKVSVEGVRTLTLRIRGKDGKDGAWGAWAEPVLQRDKK